MGSSAKILAFAGSTRKDSYNKKLVQVAARGATEAGAEVTLIDLADFPLPVFDQDFEAQQGVPEHAKKLKEIFKAHQGLIISSPEYNSSVTAVLKNTIDWLSRPAEGEPSLAAFSGKTAALLSASPGALGGLRGLVHLRAILSNIQVLVLPQQRAVGAAHEAFDAEGNLVDEKLRAQVEGIGAELAEVISKLS